MSLVEMVSRHPSVGESANETLIEASRHAMLCALFCTSCADAMSAREGDFASCIRKCSDCADVCTAVARLGVRRSAENVDLLRAALELCILACETCASECEQCEDGSCELCARMCRETAANCREAMPTVHDGGPGGYG